MGRVVYLPSASSFGQPERRWLTVSTLSLQNLHLSLSVILKIFLSPFVRSPSSCAARIILSLSNFSTPLFSHSNDLSWSISTSWTRLAKTPALLFFFQSSWFSFWRLSTNFLLDFRACLVGAKFVVGRQKENQEDWKKNKRAPM